MVCGNRRAQSTPTTRSDSVTSNSGGASGVDSQIEHPTRRSGAFVDKESIQSLSRMLGVAEAALVYRTATFYGASNRLPQRLRVGERPVSAASPEVDQDDHACDRRVGA